MSSIQDFFDGIPPITRAWFLCAMGVAAGTSFGLIEAFHFAFYWPLVYQKFQIYRLLSSFIYFGNFSFGFLMNMLILIRFGGMLERNPFQTSRVGGSVDFLFSLIVMGVIFLAIGWAMEIVFLGPLLSEAVLYLWSKKYPEAPTNIWGFALKGRHLPWALLAFNVLSGSSPLPPIIGILVGHIYFFLVEVLPAKNNKQYLRTPMWLISAMQTVQPMQHDAAYRPANVPQPPARTGHTWGGGRRLDG